LDRLIIGCGYLGCRVAARWRDAGLRVAVLTRSGQRAESLRNEGFSPVVGDVTDPQSLATLPAAETVLYAVGYDRSAAPSKRQVYVAGLKNVMDRLAGMQPKRLVYISSTSVYGDRGGEEVDETAVPRPDSPVGRARLEAERSVLAGGWTWDARPRIGRIAQAIRPPC